jgi:uncharacterized SAM-binding protein YcdF (DUF218 family)
MGHPPVPRQTGWRKRFARILLTIGLLGVAVWFLRVPILRGLGSFLVDEDPLAHADEVYVLGGAALDRGSEAARVYGLGVSQRFIFTGGNHHGELASLGIHHTEAEIGRLVAIRKGLPEEYAFALNFGTSTQEEAQVLLALATRHHSDTVVVISSRFHLRRVGNVFRDTFKEAGITVLLHGVPDHRYREETWWRREEGLLMVSNEYIKLLYYFLKY